jgi:hypothetical protein
MDPSNEVSRSKIRITPYQRSKQRREALKQQLADLQEELGQLRLSNAGLHLRYHVLTEFCGVTALLVQLLEQSGPALEGPLHQGLSACRDLAQLEHQVHGLMDYMDLTHAPQLPLTPEYCFTSLEQRLCEGVMDGSCLSLVRCALATAAAQPQAFAHLAAGTLASSRDSMLQVCGGYLLSCGGSANQPLVSLLGVALPSLAYSLCVPPGPCTLAALM